MKTLKLIAAGIAIAAIAIVIIFVISVGQVMERVG